MILLVAAARATTCAPWAAIEPPDGASDLPVNVRPFVSQEGGYAMPEPALLDSTGAPIPAMRVGRRLVPDGELPADASIVVDGGGYEIHTFTTGSHVDLAPPEVPVLLGHSWSSISNWEHGERLSFAPPSERAVLELATTTVGTAETWGPEESAHAFIGWLVCSEGAGPYPWLPPGTDIVLQARWVDLAGNRSEVLEVAMTLGEGVEPPQPAPAPEPPASDDTDVPAPPAPDEPAPARGCAVASPVPASVWAWLFLGWIGATRAGRSSRGRGPAGS